MKSVMMKSLFGCLANMFLQPCQCQNLKCVFCISSKIYQINMRLAFVNVCKANWCCHDQLCCGILLFLSCCIMSCFHRCNHTGTFQTECLTHLSFSQMLTLSSSVTSQCHNHWLSFTKCSFMTPTNSDGVHS